MFTGNQDIKQPNILDIQFLSAEGDLQATVQRMKDDGATYAFYMENDNELQADADIDDIKGGRDFRKFVE